MAVRALLHQRIHASTIRALGTECTLYLRALVEAHTDHLFHAHIMGSCVESRGFADQDVRMMNQFVQDPTRVRGASQAYCMAGMHKRTRVPEERSVWPLLMYPTDKYGQLKNGRGEY